MPDWEAWREIKGPTTVLTRTAHVTKGILSFLLLFFAAFQEDLNSNKKAKHPTFEFQAQPVPPQEKEKPQKNIPTSLIQLP